MTKKEIAIEEFSLLSRQQQLEVLHKTGVYVGKGMIQGRAAILFQLHHYYVEIVYYEYRRIVKSVKISSEINILQPYLTQIQISDLGIDVKEL